MGNGSSRDQEDLFENEVNLLQFKLLRVIGKGSFGKVRMVERRETGKVYALKYISKIQVIKMEAVRNILRERQILESLDHAFVVNMRFAFQDDEYMYMCMDLMMGGDLRFHMNRRTFSEDIVRHWIAEISSAISHLHSLGIVHRDIKPDNVLLDGKGHAHLTDFNIGCKLTPEKPFLSSQSGTVAYMAPEVFKGTGYGTSVDWWALGIVFYECMYNQRPFLTDNVPELKRAISNHAIEYPVKETISKECVSAIQGFLKKDPTERLGVKGGMDEVRRHPYFHAGAQELQMSLEEWWYMLETKQLPPKFQPPSEAANYDVTYDLEEMLLDEDPLTYHSTRKRAQRLQREREQAIKEENARLKAEHDAAVAAARQAEAAMVAMNKKLEESMRKVRTSTSSARALPTSTTTSPPTSSSLQQHGPAIPVINKKKSRLQLFGGGDQHHDSSNSKNDDGQPTIQTQPAPLQQPQAQNHHTLSQIARQTQFQSIPLSPIDTPNASRDLPTPPVPSLRFPPSPPPGQYSPPPPRQELPASPTPDHQPSSYYHRPPSFTPMQQQLPLSPEEAQDVSKFTYSTSAGVSMVPGAGPGVTAVYLSKANTNEGKDTINSHDPGSQEQTASTSPTLASPNQQSSLELIPAAETTVATAGAVHPQHPFQTAHPQKVITSPVIIPTPLDHSISRHKHIPLQQPQPQALLRQLQVGAGGVVGPRRPISPTPAMNIAAAAAAASAMANMSEDDRIAYQMDLIDREFTTFDYTVYESYDGLVDPVTMSVGNPPEWVRSRD